MLSVVLVQQVEGLYEEGRLGLAEEEDVGQLAAQEKVIREVVVHHLGVVEVRCVEPCERWIERTAGPDREARPERSLAVGKR